MRAAFNQWKEEIRRPLFCPVDENTPSNFRTHVNDLVSFIANKTPIEHIENTLKINGIFFFAVDGDYYIIK